MVTELPSCSSRRKRLRFTSNIATYASSKKPSQLTGPSNMTDALDAETFVLPISYAHAVQKLSVLRAQFEKEGEMVGVQTKFNYAWGLVKSNNRNDQQLGVRLLSDIFRVSPERRRECLYYLALGNYKLGNYGEARRYNDLLLDKEPANLQATDLRQLIDDKVAKEGLLGVAIISGIGIAAGVVGAFLLRNTKRR
ncbi:mitochondrial fission 1 protein [Trichoderma asperellum]|uniref:Mitochondrial fission 1 protein n=1 Tax=Trichoderma asperellum TaxID=101201 RepID=A0A6V8QT32_TRIAP|nr:mitochondrial fission 1 protein [Trichoderma asperellum]